MLAPNATAVPGATALDRSDESATTTLHRAAVGPINADYYLPIFTRFESANRAGFSWNWAASLYTLNWMAFRHLWVAALVYVGAMIFVPLIVFGIGRLVFQFSETAEIGLLVAWGALSFVVPGVAGNALLHADSRKKMARALSASNTLADASAMLLHQASSRQRFVWLGLVNVLLAGAALGVYLAIPGAGKSPLASPPVAEARILAEGGAADLTPKPTPAASAALPLPTPPASSPTQPASSPQLAASPALAASAAVPEPTSSASASVMAKAVPAPEPEAPLPKAAEAAKTKASAPAPASAKGFYINVGLFAQDANARKAHTTLQEAGLTAFTQELDTSKGKRTRVRVGPFDTRSEANAAAEKIRALKLDALVFQQ